MQPAENETYRVVITRGDNREILAFREDERVSLPAVTVPKWQRLAYCVTERIAELWNLETIYLFQPTLQPQSQEMNHANYLVLEARNRRWQPVANLKWVFLEELSSQLPSNEAQVLRGILETADSYNKETSPGPFARAGWLDEASSWVQSCLEIDGLRLTGKFRQFNGGPFFSLIRFETGGPAMWFKAVGEPNVREFHVTCELAQRYPRFFPRIMGVHRDWNAWLMQEVEGTQLDDALTFPNVANAVGTLADLQLELMRCTNDLTELGCPDWGLPRIFDHIDPFCQVAEALMRQQTTNAPPPMTPAEVRGLGFDLKAACYRLADVGIPSSITNGDFSPYNIVVDPDRCIFIDLAETYIGHPFFTFQYLLDWMHTYHPELDPWQDQLSRIYAEKWTMLASSSGIAQALLLSRLLTVFWHAAGANGWNNQQGYLDKNRAKYLRALTRRMKDRASQIPNLRDQCYTT